jgi:hypothetical protein
MGLGEKDGVHPVPIVAARFERHRDFGKTLSAVDQLEMERSLRRAGESNAADTAVIHFEFRR